MSLVVSFVDKDGNMWMGADSCGSGGSLKGEYKNRKLFRAKGDVFVGLIGSYVLQNQISANIKVFNNAHSVKRDLLNKVVPILHEVIDEDTMDKSSMLVMFNSRIFVIQGDYSVLEVAENHKAIGVHAVAADAVMDVLTRQEENTLSTEQILMKTFSAMSRYSEGIGFPFYITNTVDGKMRKYLTIDGEGIPVTGGW